MPSLAVRTHALRAGGIEDKYLYRAKTAGDRGDQPGNLILITDIGDKALGDAAILTDAAADGSDQVVAGPAVDRDGKAVPRQAPRDHRPQAPRAARHQRDTPIRHCHAAIIPRRSAHRPDPGPRRRWRGQTSPRHSEFLPPGVEFALLPFGVDSLTGVAPMSYWADSAFLAAAGIPTVLYRPEGDGAHADTEWVSRSGTTTATTVLTQLAQDFCSYRPERHA